MELSAESSNYIKLSYIILDVVAKHLRKYFIKLWDAKYPDEKWKDKIDEKNHKLKSLLIKDRWKLKLLDGSEEDWDTYTLLYAILDSKSLKLMQDGSREKNNIEDIRSFYNDLLNPSNADFEGLMTRMKVLSKDRFGEDAEKEITYIDDSQVTPEMKKEVEQLLKCMKPTMKVPTETESYVKLAYVLLNVVAKHLRRYFIELWDKRHPSEKWDGIDYRAAKLQKLLVRNKYEERMLDGNEESWDTTTLVHAILDSGLDLMEGCRLHSERSLPLRESEQIDIIRRIRNSDYGHVLCMSCSDERFNDIMADIRCVAKEIFGEEAEKELEKIEASPITPSMKEEIKQLIDKFKCETELQTKVLSCQIERFQEVLSGDVKEIKEDGKEMKSDVKKILNITERIANERLKLPLRPYTDKDIDELKEKYKVMYQEHSINKVDKHGRIVMKAVNVQDFAVKLKISETRPPAATYKDETRQHFEHLAGMSGTDIELNKLISHDDRVALVCGAPGLGKTVLTKQLAFLWATNKIYTEFKLCIIMECRHINHFIANNGAMLKRHELFSEFLKVNFACDLRGGLSTLFIIDGIDELEDNNTNESVIWQVLDVKHAEYTKAKIILTGRPHVEAKLERRSKDIGGLHRCEIQGLSDEQIRDYVRKFDSCKEDVVKIDKAINSSKEYVKIISVPAFLNSMCCVALLSDGQTVKNTAELYIWLLYLLLREHCDKDGPSRKGCSESFEEYSSDLWTLCEICHHLLSENKIIFEGDVTSRLLKCGKGTKFLKGFFADISDMRTKKYQFKHLTILEILSAVHICHMKNRMEIINHILRKEFYQVVIFICQLIAGYKYDGIIKDMFGNDENLKAIAVERFLPSVLELIGQCINHELKGFGQQRQQLNQFFQLSIDIIMCFINKDVSNKKFIISTVQTLRYEMDGLNMASMRKVSELCGHLSNTFQCNEEDFKATFENVHLKWVKVDDVKSLTCVKYLPNVEEMELRELKSKSFHIRSEVNAVAKCKEVGMAWCDLANDEIVDIMAIKDHQLKVLIMYGCNLNKYSFINVSNWALAAVNYFELSYIHNIECSWWGKLVDAIQNAKEKNNGYLALRELEIHNCTQEMSKEVEIKIVQCGVKLKINDRRVKLQSDSSSTLNSSLSESRSTELMDSSSTSNSSFSESSSPEPLDEAERDPLSYDQGHPSFIPSLPSTSTSPTSASSSSQSLETRKRTNGNSSGIFGEKSDFDDQMHPKRAKCSSIGEAIRIPERDDLSFNESISYENDADILDKEANKIQVVIGKLGKALAGKYSKISLDIPSDAVDDEVQLEISSLSAIDAPPTPCDFGDFILSDVLLIRPIGTKFRKPASLSIEHGITDLQELSSIIIKWYHNETKEWLPLSVLPGRAKQQRGVTAVAVSDTSYFVVCKSLDAEFYTINKFPSVYSPFGSKYNVKLVFEENTFGIDDDVAVLEVKMNVFSDLAIVELNHFGFHPFPVLHMKEKSHKQPIKPFTVVFPMIEDLRSDEQLLLFQGDNEKVDITEIKFEIGEQFVSVQLHHCFGWSMLCKTSTKGLVSRGNQIAIRDFIRQYTGPAFKVQFAACTTTDMNGERVYRILCYRDYKSKFAENMKTEYEDVTNLTQARLYSNTEVTIKLDGQYEIDNDDQIVKLRFDHSLGVNVTAAFKVKERTPNTKVSNFIISKGGGKIQLAKVLFYPNLV